MPDIKLLIADITQAKVDAIVNAANPRMLGGGGVDGAIHEAAGPELLVACQKVPVVNGMRCPFGEARITTAGNLPASYVIHTAGPIYANEAEPQVILTASYNNSLQLALAHKCQSIAFPAISCGVYGYPIKEAARIALATCDQQQYRQLAIYFYLFNQQVYDSWQSAYQQMSA
jgi:O-acetyl-ADP-ribose deacetylase (regulator of RNase III)